MNDIMRDATAGGAEGFDASVVRVFHDRLDEAVSTEDVLAEIRCLEEAKNAIAARQARLTVAAHDRQRQRDIQRGIDRAATARKVGSDVALARRSSPHLGSRLLGLAHAVAGEMPNTFAAFAAGVIGERDVTALVAATAFLSRDDRGRVDAAIVQELGTVSHRRLVAAAHAAAYQADPAAATARRAKAESERRVSLRPAPDCMTYLTALLPVKDGVACYAALKAVSDATATAEHPRGQVMADTVVERVTGRTTAQSADVHVNLIMPLDSLTGDTPADLPGYGPIPADLAREWVKDPQREARIRRLFTYPGTGDLVGMESTSRCYTGLLADFIALRDRTCRTPFCDAPIRHTDHIVSHADGGPTSERNGEGLCERCNYVKEHPDYLVGGDAGGNLCDDRRTGRHQQATRTTRTATTDQVLDLTRPDEHRVRSDTERSEGECHLSHAGSARHGGLITYGRHKATSRRREGSLALHHVAGRLRGRTESLDGLGDRFLGPARLDQ